MFSEIAVGKREPLKIRNISSSDLTVYLDYAPPVCACVALAVEIIVALYKKMLEIKKLKKELADQQVPEDKLRGIEDDASSMVSPQLDELTVELMNKYGGHLEVQEEMKSALSSNTR